AALHRRIFSDEVPFVVCDRRRGTTRATVRSPASYRSGVAALKAAGGGSVCVHRRRLPPDFSAMASRLRSQSDAVLFVCGDRREEPNPFLVRQVPVSLPSLRVRWAELPRIVDEYASDALAELRSREVRPTEVRFTDEDRRWVIERCPKTLEEIEKSTLRILA